MTARARPTCSTPSAAARSCSPIAPMTATPSGPPSRNAAPGPTSRRCPNAGPLPPSAPSSTATATASSASSARSSTTAPSRRATKSTTPTTSPSSNSPQHASGFGFMSRWPRLPTMLVLTDDERAMAGGRDGAGIAMAMRIVAEAARLLGADRLIPIASAHIDGCLYHGDSGVLFAERLAADEARVAVPATLNVGALDLLRPENVRLPPARAAMAKRLMDAYLALGCSPTWTCATYQAGDRKSTRLN